MTLWFPTPGTAKDISIISYILLLTEVKKKEEIKRLGRHLAVATQCKEM